MKEQRISAGKPTFRTPDGMEHETWNAARKHLTGLDLLETIRLAAPDLAEARLVAIRDHIQASWSVSRRKQFEERNDR